MSVFYVVLKNIVVLIFLLLFIFHPVSAVPSFVNSGAGCKISSSAYFIIKENCKNSNSGTFTNNGNIKITGNIDNSATWSSGNNSNIKFNGTVSQQISTTSTLIFYNTEIDNGAGVSLTSGDIQVNGVLTFTNGGITTSSNKVIIENNNTFAIIGHDVTKYINGILKRKVAATGSYDFPIGTFSYYELANVNLVSGSTVTYLTATFTTDNTGKDISGLGITVFGTPVTDRLNYGWWSITPASGTATNYDVTLTSRGQTNGGASATQHCILKGTGSSESWQSLGTHDNSTQSGTGSNPVIAKRTALSGFSDFCIARSTSAPLPIELLSFTASCNSPITQSLNSPSVQSILLEWSTASETNNNYFSIERSTDAQNWETIADVDGAGNSNQSLYYFYTDYDISNEGLHYYCLINIDYDGTKKYNNIIVANCKNNDFGVISIYPNPVTNGQLYYQICSSENTDVESSITDVLGRILFQNKFSIDKGINQLTIDLSHLSNSLYFFKVATTNGLYKDCKQIIIDK
ncbi:MAG: hypothetical protein A2491_05875 [Bacteroidetes bacterium RIFOXYC12_FULL_35_7]|nr:MAG: hypothetical protein A2491_05875 [Bacteroidetes bacterium RIFOXYC12_FULL_35_7]